MNIRISAALLLVVLMLFAFSACDSQEATALTAEQAQEIALEEAGLTAEDVTDLHSHAIAPDHVPMYNIHFNCDGTEHSYNIHASTGEILSSE